MPRDHCSYSSRGGESLERGKESSLRHVGKQQAIGSTWRKVCNKRESSQFTLGKRDPEKFLELKNDKIKDML